jgi:hypothetical protein
MQSKQVEKFIVSLPVEDRESVIKLIKSAPDGLPTYSEMVHRLIFRAVEELETRETQVSVPLVEQKEVEKHLSTTYISKPEKKEKTVKAA